MTKPRDTRLLEIRVTLGNPEKAQAVAQFLAEERKLEPVNFAAVR